MDASSIAGYLSILCWLIVFTPQLWENYTRKSGDGLSVTFLVIWLAGDVFNLLGVIMQDLLVTMFVLALYYTVADMALIWQVFYYKKKRSQHKHYHKRSFSDEEHVHIPHQSQISTFAFFNAVSFLSMFLVTTFSCYSYYQVHNSDKVGNEIEWLPQVMGWTSAVLYVGSRIPQLAKNWKSQSTEGLSMGMFFCAVMGNVLFSASIFLKSTERSYLLMNLSWLVGSCGTLLFDFIVSYKYLLRVYI
ncbi:PQ loop repeat-domain-containing protein [Mycotypha africana]|uniref:PQ loop repeat-domain-containing protein n=1 Tax=Mycotypha africana TaxID=64632 RepID=UPI0022FFCE45|nr:PQ loop repeat-domain-containing protein [Mycotypha africana]KAI8977314.1 PQ loop repeat-domain-containing protein [Mycotypha africana]